MGRNEKTVEMPFECECNMEIMETEKAIVVVLIVLIACGLTFFMPWGYDRNRNYPCIRTGLRCFKRPAVLYL